jgi:hypothetical protein
MSSRWDGDQRGRGVADAEHLVQGAGELVAAFGDPGWVAEQPEKHLGPHIEEWCRRDGRVAVRGASTDDRGVFVLDLEWRGETGDVGQIRATMFSLIGSFAEGATYVRQYRGDGDGDGSVDLCFEVGTGEVTQDARFQPHGHVVVIQVAR